MADKPVVNPTPKMEFQSNGNFIKMHREMMQQPMLSVSIQYALLQFARTLSDRAPVDGNNAAQNFYKIQGAHDFIHVLRNLAEMPELPPTKLSAKNLTQ